MEAILDAIGKQGLAVVIVAVGIVIVLIPAGRKFAVGWGPLDDAETFKLKFSLDNGKSWKTAAQIRIFVPMSTICPASCWASVAVSCAEGATRVKNSSQCSRGSGGCHWAATRGSAPGIPHPWRVRTRTSRRWW